MLALEPDAVVWSVADLEINDGVTTDSYNHPTPVTDVATVMDALVVWANATFAHVFGWSWARDPATGGAIITLSATGGTFTLEATNADAQTGYGLSAGLKAAAAAHTFDTAAVCTWAPTLPIAVRANMRILDRGDACGDGAIRPGVPGLATYRPRVEAMGSALDAARLASVLADAGNPRRAAIYQLHTDMWLALAVGDVSRSPVGAVNYRFELSCSGDAA